MFYKNQIIAQSNNHQQQAEDSRIIQLALQDISRKTISKIIQIGQIRIGITSFRYKSDILAFAAISSNVQPKILLDCSTALSETYVQNFSHINDIEQSKDKYRYSLEKEFENVQNEYNKKIQRQQKDIQQINRNIEEGIDISKQSIEKLIETENELCEIEEQSKQLTNSAQTFEKQSIQLKQEIYRQKLKVYAMISLVALCSIYVFYKAVI